MKHDANKRVVPEQDMGVAIRASIGFALALYALSPQTLMAHLATPSVYSLKAQLAAVHPSAKLAELFRK